MGQDLDILRLTHSHDLGIAEMISKVSIVVCLLLAVPFLAYGLQCYQCNSAEDKECMDPFVEEPINDGEQPKVKQELKDKFLKTCPAEETLCRKTDQYVRGEASVIRSCATEEYKNECYKTVLELQHPLLHLQRRRMQPRPRLPRVARHHRADGVGGRRPSVRCI